MTVYFKSAARTRKTNASAKDVFVDGGLSFNGKCTANHVTCDANISGLSVYFQLYTIQYILAAMTDRPRSVERLLPLKPKVLHILLALADGPRHGYSIMQEVAARTDGHVRVWPAAMYGTLRELEELDWIAESETRPSDDDERRRYFALTPLGKRVLSGEVRRLEAIVDHARASRALRRPGRA